MPGSRDYYLLLDNLPLIEKNIGKNQSDDFLYELYCDFFAHCVGGKTMENITYEELKRQIGSLSLPKKENLLLQLEISDYVDKGQAKELLKKLEETVLTGDEIRLDRSAVQTLGKKFSKKEYGRLAGWLAKAIADPSNKSLKHYLERGEEYFRSLSWNGIYFQNLTLRQALEKSERLDKLLFVYCYSSRSDSCKYVMEKLFQEKSMEEYMNQRFICVKYDLEKEDGLELTKKFRIETCPAFLVLETGGTVRNRFTRCDNTETFIEEIGKSFTEAVGQ